PEALETVERAAVPAEDVHHEVEVVEEDPLRSLDALDERRTLPHVLAERLLDAVGDGGDLPRILSGADDEVVREPFRFSQVEHDDVGRQLVASRADRGAHGLWKPGPGLALCLSLRHAIYS